MVVYPRIKLVLICIKRFQVIEKEIGVLRYPESVSISTKPEVSTAR